MLPTVYTSPGRPARLWVVSQRPGRARLRPYLILSARLPAQAEGVSRPIVLTLDDVPRAAVVEAENLIRQVQPLHEHSKTLPHAVAGLGVDLQVRHQINVACGALRT